jgi:acetyl esterase/lipase
MIKCLAFGLLLAFAAGVGGPRHPPPRQLIQAGLSDNPQPAPGASPAASERPAVSCDGVTFTRSVKYGADSRNVLDAATAQTRPGAKRPVLVFFAGDSFVGDGGADAMKALVEQAMCFAANNGLVAFHASYRLAPLATWPAAAKDVAGAISWIYENADLFGGNKEEIIPVGYGTGAFHVASFLAHKELQEKDDYVAGAVLVSGIYHPSKDAGDGERAYLGEDTSTYDSRSAIKGLTEVEEPIVLAWSKADEPRFIAQGEKLNETLCSVGHCPRTSVLSEKPASPASVFDLDGVSADLHERVRQLIGQLDARGLP